MKRILCVILSLLLLLGVLASCKSESGEKENQSDSANESLAPVGTPISEYSIVRSITSDSYTGKVTVELKKILDEASGGSIGIHDDYVAEDETVENKKEILIGNTNRPESKALYEELGDAYRYVIRQMGEKLVVAAPTAELLGEATKYLTEHFMKATGDGSYPLAGEISYESEELSYLELVTERELNYQIVYPSAASTGLMVEITEIKNALKALSKTEPAMLPDTGSTVAQTQAIVLGNVNMPGVDEMAESLPYLGYQRVHSGNKEFFITRDDVTATALCEDLAERIPQGKDKNGTVRILLPEKNVGYALDWAEEIPAFRESTGQTCRIEEFAEGLYRIYYQNATKQQLEDYKAILADQGFKLYAENQIGENRYLTYQGSRAMIYLYYTDHLKEIRLLVCDLEDMVPYHLTPVSDGNVTEPKLTLMAPDYDSQPSKNNGMSMVFTMKDGSFVIIDGGWKYDTQTLYNYLKENNQRSDGILIRAWIITHPHEDHYGNLVSFSSLYADKVTVENFVAHFAVGDYAVKGSADDDVAIILPAMEKFKEARLLVPQVGQKMYFGEMSMEFLYTVECPYPAASIGDSNNHSLCIKTDFYGKDILITGDSYSVPCNYLIKTFGSYIQSDYLQVPHHSGNGGSASFYNLVKPRVILVPTSQERYNEASSDSSEPLYYLLHRMNTVKKIYLADHKHQIIE